MVKVKWIVPSFRTTLAGLVILVVVIPIVIIMVRKGARFATDRSETVTITVGSPKPTIIKPTQELSIEPILTSANLDTINWTLYTDLNKTSEIVIDRQGFIWSAGFEGAVRWNALDGTYEKYTVKEGLKENEVISIAQAPDDSIWFLTTNYLSHLQNGRWTNLPIPVKYKASCMAIAPNGDIWVGTDVEGTGYGIYQLNNKGWSLFTAKDGLTSGGVQQIAVTSKGAVLALLEHGNLLYFDGKYWHSWTQLKLGSGYSMAVAPDDTVWLSDGTQIRRSHGTQWQTFTTSPNIIYQLSAAVTDILWMSTDKGLVRFDGKTNKFLSTEDCQTTLCVGYDPIAADPSGGVWAKTDSGLSHYDGQVWKGRYHVDGLEGDVHDAAAVADGSIWFAVDRGVIRLDGNNWQLNPEITN